MELQLLFAVFAGIALLLFLILKLKIQAFLSLLIVCIAVGIFAGMPATEILETMKDGMGSTLGFVATVVGLGALFGGVLEQSGGAQRLASFLLKKTGDKRAPWAMMVTGFAVAIPVFFDVAFIILVPVTYALSKRTGKSLLLYALPLLAGLAITHAFIPPTPGPIAVADILGADLGWVIVFGFLAGIPAAIISGPIFARFISKRIKIEPKTFSEEIEYDEEKAPSPGLIISIILIPIFLIVANTLVQSPLFDGVSIPGSILYTIELVGHPFSALIIANLIAWYFLGVKRGMQKEFLKKVATKSFQAAGIIILLTGAGGAFKQILINTGAGEMIADALNNAWFNPLLFGFIVAALVRVLQGSSTVAMITAAGITAPVLTGGEYSMAQTSLIVIAIASGASILSHVNDSGFWLVGQYLGLTEKQTFKTWTVMTTLIAVVGLLVSLILWFLI
ncbi:GntP family permease [Salegentibacter mishustinae]|uniref:Gluconate transporter n=1 Tax=Salegentibacter mishustinae TaxID=270918 RepID=A0A0Q9Z5S8_9FLAO|nr:gluconate:H+ symporter [Salegentibacter mishustinae]KRG27177.1 gluconate transporter [Salegentibacter mishustinae]PNW21411.1 gluconate transporter [Salegentibacter mishustinae]PZX62642.1 Gnt-I system low-affinity gluconate transporter [Salegentibacter mishustinae]GGW97262.1 gluconate transporter [Salegentibacter mishustinae]